MFFDDAHQYKEYLPERLQDYVEINAVDQVIKIELQSLMNHIKQNITNKAIKYADEAGVLRWEKILGVSAPLNSTLQARRDALTAKLMTKPPINLQVLKAIVEAYMGLEVDITVENFTVKIRYRGESRIADLNPLYATAYKIIPANLLMQIAYLWVTWGEVKASFPTWGDAAAKTWGEIRKGV